MSRSDVTTKWSKLTNEIGHWRPELCSGLLMALLVTKKEQPHVEEQPNRRLDAVSSCMFLWDNAQQTMSQRWHVQIGGINMSHLEQNCLCCTLLVWKARSHCVCSTTNHSTTDFIVTHSLSPEKKNKKKKKHFNKHCTAMQDFFHKRILAPPLLAAQHTTNPAASLAS